MTCHTHPGPRPQPTSFPNPRALGVPHDTWRTHQYEAFTQLRHSMNNGISHHFLEAPTGSGKSALATALAVDSQVLVLVATLGLLDQYHREYGFAIVKGRQEYECIDPDRITEWTNIYEQVPSAFECPHARMDMCEHSEECPYLVAKRRATLAQRVAVTYKYASLARWPKQRTGILVCDECHTLAEEVLSFGHWTIGEWHQRKYGVPDPRKHFIAETHRACDDFLMGRLRAYIQDCITATRHYEKDKDSPEGSRGYRFHIGAKYLLTDTLPMTPDWFLDVGPQVAKGKPGLMLRPLDARPIAHRLWEKKHGTVLMSATIGDPKPLAGELGIEGYEFTTLPHLIPADKRPVDVIFSQKLTHAARKANPGVYRGQALAISHWVNSLPEHYRGIILTTSYHKIRELKQHLELNGRLWQAPGNCQGVTARIQAFINDPSPGIVAVDTIQGWGHGLDLRGDLGHFVVVAGVQHSNPSDPYDRARKSKPGGQTYQWWMAYSGVVQACGRVTRGTLDEHGEYILKHAALADGSALTKAALRYYPKWFKDALQQ